jgi:hypothetical protein
MNPAIIRPAAARSIPRPMDCGPAPRRLIRGILVRPCMAPSAHSARVIGRAVTRRGWVRVRVGSRLLDSD